MNNISDFEKVREKLLKTIKNYPKESEDKVFYGDWTIKEVIGHVSAWDIYFTSLLKALTKDKPYKHWGDINDFNDIEVKKRKHKTLVQLIKELEKVSKEFVEVYNDISPKLVSNKIWDDKKYTPQDILKIQIHHYENQEKQISKRK